MTSCSTQAQFLLADSYVTDFTMLRSGHHRILSIDSELLEITRRYTSEKNAKIFPDVRGITRNWKAWHRWALPSLAMSTTNRINLVFYSHNPYLFDFASFVFRGLY